MHSLKSFIGFILVLVLGHSSFAQSPFDAIESIQWHEGSKTWFASNLGGGKVTLEVDGYGWITRLDASGKVIAPKWVEGLNAPTGMAFVGNLLYVADRGEVVEIDIATAKILRKIKLEGSEFVNDVAAAPNGDVYVSDTFKDRIYRIRKNAPAEVFLESAKLEYPNGLLVDGNNLIVATWGPMTNRATFETSHQGTLLKVDLKTKQISPVGEGKPIANFDGVVKVGANYYGTDWVGGRLLKITPAGVVTVVMTGFSQLADLGYNAESGTIGLAEMSNNRLYFLHVQ